MFRLDTAEENKNEHFQLQIMNKRRIRSAEGELTNKCVAVWGDFQNRLESKLSLCKTAIPDSFFFWKTMMMQGWRMRIMPFLNIWPMEPNFPMCNGLQRKKFTRVCEVFCFYSHSSQTQHHTSSNHMYCSHHSRTSIRALHLLPRPNILMWLHFALHEVFPLVSLVPRSLDIFHLYLVFLDIR